MQQVLLPKGMAREGVIGRIQRLLASLPLDKAWRVEIAQHKARRSDQQNRYLFGVCYPTILREGGEAMGGWTADDLHEFFLIDHFGSEVSELFGRKRLKPLRRSSRLDKQEFSDFIGHIQRFMADKGVFIPDADPDYWRNDDTSRAA